MDGIRAAPAHTVVEALQKMGAGTPRRSTLGLLLILVAFGASGCADPFCGPTNPDNADPSCSIYAPMQPTYFPAVI
jgi:hypothetical protein